MKIILLYATLFVFFSSGYFISDSFASICNPIDLVYHFEHDSSVTFCKYDNAKKIEGTVFATQSDILILEVPRTLVDRVYVDCTAQPTTIYIHGDGYFADEIINATYRVATIDIMPGNYTFTWAGFAPLSDPFPFDYCGAPNGYLTKYAPPNTQLNNGIKPELVKCNEGLDIVIKSSNGNPACVKSETKQKLIERGWAKSFS